MPNTKNTNTKETITHNEATWPMLKKWNTKLAGVKPIAKELQNSVDLGYRAGTQTAFAVAMYLRKGGATQGQVQAANGLPYLNVHRQMVINKASKNKTAVTATKTKAEIDGKHFTVYTVALKGKAAKAAPKAPKGGKGKANKKPSTRNTSKKQTATPAPATS